MIKKTSQKTIYQNTWMTVYEDGVEFPDGSTSIYGYVERPHGVTGLVQNSQGEVLLLKQYRYPIHDWEWGLPGGAVEPGETTEQALTREIVEETGLHALTMEKIGQFFPLSSCSTEYDELFVVTAEGELSASPGVGDESITELKFVKMLQAIRMIDQGEITDAYTCNAIQMLARRTK